MQEPMDDDDAMDFDAGEALELLTDISEVNAENIVRLLRRFSVVPVEPPSDD